MKKQENSGKKNSVILRRVPSSEEWLVNNRPQMVDCPHQPGRLRLSREACQKRTLAGQRIALEDEGRFLLGQNGLLLCRQCPIGNDLISDQEGSRNHARRAAPLRKEPPAMEFTRW